MIFIIKMLKILINSHICNNCYIKYSNARYSLDYKELINKIFGHIVKVLHFCLNEKI